MMVASDHSLEEKYVLLVEDDNDIRQTMSEVLEEEGYNVAKARNGREALLQLETNARRPAAILLDLMMPIMDGYEFRLRQQKQPKWASIPVVIVSADRNGRERAREMAVAGYFEKPLNIDELLSLLKRLV